jgi:hypothetical protein
MKLIISAAALATFAAACGGTREITVGATTLTGSTNVARADAIDRITTQRCDRELSCGNIGPSRTWTDMAACRDSVSEDTKRSVKSDVDYFDLAVCANAIRNTQCATGGLPRLAECDGAKICR